jgi:small subunit ribosomal protein S7
LSVLQVPIAVGERKQRSLAIKWLINAARARKGKPMHVKLFEELSDAAKGEVR